MMIITKMKSALSMGMRFFAEFKNIRHLPDESLSLGIVAPTNEIETRDTIEERHELVFALIFARNVQRSYLRVLKTIKSKPIVAGYRKESLFRAPMDIILIDVDGMIDVNSDDLFDLAHSLVNATDTVAVIMFGRIEQRMSKLKDLCGIGYQQDDVFFTAVRKISKQIQG
jgi:hypothetical protein